jgi:hypothetical protein
VLIALVVLWRSIDKPATPEQPAEVHEAQQGSTATSTTAARSQHPLAPAPGGERAESAPVPDDYHPPPGSMENKKNLHYGGTQLRTQTKAVDPLVRQCVQQAVGKPTGDAVLTFIVAVHGDKVEVEDTGIDQDKTTLQDQKLLDCLRETARSMKFEGLPREAEALVVNRSVKLENGALTEYRLIGFSYLR